LLSQDRPRLADTLTALLRAGTLVLLGAEGLDDVFARTLVQVISRGHGESRGEDDIDVLLPFSNPDRDYIQRKYAWLLELFSPMHAQGRVVFYRGVNVHYIFPSLCRKLAPRVSEPPDAASTEATGPLGRETLPGGTLVSVYEHVAEPGRKTNGPTER
jgi:hypothetical protein